MARITDKERLDWLQKSPWALEDCVDIASQGKGEKDPIGFSFHDEGRVLTSVRAAIDAAIRAERKPKEDK